MEFDWYDVVARLIEILLADDKSKMGVMVGESKYGRQEAWHEGHCLGKARLPVGRKETVTWTCQ